MPGSLQPGGSSRLATALHTVALGLLLLQPSFAAEGTGSYIVVLEHDTANGYSHAHQVAAELEASGGSIRRNLADMGLLFVDGDAAFAKRAGAAPGVHAVGMDGRINAGDGAPPDDALRRRTTGLGSQIQAASPLHPAIPPASGSARTLSGSCESTEAGSRNLRGAGDSGSGSNDCHDYDSKDYEPDPEVDSGTFTRPELEKYQWALKAMSVHAVHESGITGRSRDGTKPVFRAKVALIGDGVALNHPDLDNVFDTQRARSFVPGEGYEYLFPCAVFACDDDPFSLATVMASVIAADAGDGGVLGIAPDARATPYKVVSDLSGDSQDSWVIEAVKAAADAGHSIILVGLLLGPGDPARIAAYANAAAYAADRGAIILVGAGDRYGYPFPDGDTPDLGLFAGVDLDVELRTGAWVWMDTPNVYPVSALGPTRYAADRNTNLDRLAVYSNYGGAVAFAAPGGDFRLPLVQDDSPCWDFGPDYLNLRPCALMDQVWAAASPLSEYGPPSTISAGYFPVKGTRVAAAHVAGIAALIVGLHGELMTPDALIEALKATCDDLGKEGKDPVYGYGRPNAAKIAGLRL